MDSFTMNEGRLELDEGQGRKDGPRIIDPKAGLVRFEDPTKDIPFSQLRAVASVYTERQVWVHIGSSREWRPVLVHSVVLVPRRLRDDVAALLDALEAGRSPGPGYSIRGAAMSVDEDSVHFDMVHSARDSRRTSKMIARLARLPVVELYGEFPVWRPADRLDLSLRERLKKTLPPAAVGPPPDGIRVAIVDHALELAVTPPPRSNGKWYALIGASVLLDVPLLIWATPAGAAVLVVAIALLVIALRTGRPKGGRLRVGHDAIDWSCGEQQETFPTDRLEMMRVSDGTLVLVQHDDETRCEFGSEAYAVWARAAIEAFLAADVGAAYR
jgi:hypothetical protein